MRTALDTNVISALWSREPAASQVSELLGRAQRDGGLVVCAPVYIELLAHPRATPAFVNGFLAATNIRVDFELDEALWREAGRGFVAYIKRRRASKIPESDAPRRLLVDFVVGAHATQRAERLFTLDPARYSGDFPRLRLMP